MCINEKKKKKEEITLTTKKDPIIQETLIRPPPTKSKIKISTFYCFFFFQVKLILNHKMPSIMYVIYQILFTKFQFFSYFLLDKNLFYFLENKN